MAKCATCRRTLITAGAKAGGRRYCNAKCRDADVMPQAADMIPEEIRLDATLDVFNGACPQCGGDGPVDVQYSWYTWSALFISNTQTKTLVGCRACGNRARVRDTMLTAGLGWWSFPWGILISPFTIARNVGRCFGPDPEHPTEDLEQVVMLELMLATHASSETSPTAEMPPPLGDDPVLNRG